MKMVSIPEKKMIDLIVNNLFHLEINKKLDRNQKNIIKEKRLNKEELYFLKKIKIYSQLKRIHTINIDTLLKKLLKRQ